MLSLQLAFKCEQKISEEKMKKRITLIIALLTAAVLVYGQTVIGYTSFEEPEAVAGKYIDADAATNHTLVNNDGQPIVIYTSVGGEMGFTAFYTNTQSSTGLYDDNTGDYIGVTNYTGDVTAFADGTQGYGLSDTDGMVTVTFDPVTVSTPTTIYFSAKYFIAETGWETSDPADHIRIWLTIDGTDVDLLNTTGLDIDDLNIEDVWTTLSHETTVNTSMVLHFEVESNSASETVYMDDIVFTTGGAVPNAPVADAGPDLFAETGSTVTLDGSGSSDIDDNIMSYEWEMIWGTQVSPTLTNPDSAVCTFTAPITPQDFRFTLTVTDSTGLSDVDTVEVAVREPQESELIFSEYIEGSSNNKAYEIYNVTDGTVDLTPYVVKLSRDGAGWGYYDTGDARDAMVLDLAGSLGPGEVYVVARTEAEASILAVADTTFEYSSSTAGAYTVCFNGNDALGLFLNDVLVDAIGDPSSGSNFDCAGVTGATQDHTLIRKAYVDSANPNWSSSAGWDADNSEWIVYEQDHFTDLGSHTAGPVAYSFSNSTVGTDFPQAGSEISISVDITPDEGVSAPTAVKVWYGFDGSQPNSADMWLESGTTWAGAIPALSQGDKALDYYIGATGTETVNSALYSMTVAGNLTDISDIHTNVDTYDGTLKTIEGIITIGAGILRDDFTSCYIQDESGKGLNLYYGSALLSDLTRGTKVKLVGTVTPYFSTIEIENFSYTIVSTGNELPATNYVTVPEANSDEHEGTLTTVSGTFAAVQDYSSSKNIILTSGTDSAIVKVWPTTGIDPSSYTLGNEYSITGVGSQYSGEYQLLVGYATDITPYTAICEDCTPSDFVLNKAYPNPFNPLTTIEFSLAEAGDFTMSVYNIAGQRVDVLASGYAEPGIYKQVWNAADFTSGVYFIRLEAGANIATQKVVLIK